MKTTTEIKEHPILFTDEMVRAILAGRKTQTRRVVKPQPRADHLTLMPSGELVGICPDGNPVGNRDAPRRGWMRCPYGEPGDRLVVREAFQYADWTDDGDPYIRYRADGEVRLCQVSEEWVDRAGDIWAKLSARDNYAIDSKAADRCWRPNIHMPRWASRLTLEITSVRVQRLQDISEADAKAEGVKPYHCPQADALMDAVGSGMKPIPYTSGFANLWNEINSEADQWWSNPWVWAISFRKVEAR